MEFIVEFGAEVEDCFLLEGVIDEDAQKIEKVASKEGRNNDKDVRYEQVDVPLLDDLSHHTPGHCGECQEHHRHEDGAEKLCCCKAWIFAQVGKDSEDSLHVGRRISTS